MEEDVEKSVEKQETLADVIEDLALRLEVNGPPIETGGDLAQAMWASALSTFKQINKDWRKAEKEDNKEAQWQDINAQAGSLEEYLQDPIDYKHQAVDAATLAAVKFTQKHIVSKEIDKLVEPLKAVVKNLQKNEDYAVKLTYDVIKEMENAYNEQYKDAIDTRNLKGKTRDDIGDIVREKVSVLDDLKKDLKQSIQKHKATDDVGEFFKDHARLAALKEGGVDYVKQTDFSAQMQEKGASKKSKKFTPLEYMKAKLSKIKTPKKEAADKTPKFRK